MEGMEAGEARGQIRSEEWQSQERGQALCSTWGGPTGMHAHAHACVHTCTLHTHMHAHTQPAPASHPSGPHSSAPRGSHSSACSPAQEAMSRLLRAWHHPPDYPGLSSPTLVPLR